jgi:hypothetical protein
MPQAWEEFLDEIKRQRQQREAAALRFSFVSSRSRSTAGQTHQLFVSTRQSHLNPQ